MNDAIRALDAARGGRTPEEVAGAEIRRVCTAGYTFAEALSKPLDTSYLIKGFVRPGEITVLFGDSGALKSFVAVDAGLHFAAGSARWLDHRVRGPGGVLFIIGEGASGFPKRLKVWAMERGATSLPAYVHPAPVDIFESPELLQDVIEQAEAALGCPVVLIVLDPLGVMLGAGDESKNPDVSRALTNLRLALGSLRAALLIHHVGHGDKGRERGASTIRTNADARFLVKYQEFTNIVTIGHLKEKEDAPGDPVYLTARVVVLGTDDDGDSITSLVLAPTAERPTEATDWKGAVKQSDQQALRELVHMWLEGGRFPVLSTAWRQELHRLKLLPEKDQPDTSAGNRRAFQRMAKVLRDAGLIVRTGFNTSTAYTPATPGVDTEGAAT